MLGIPEHRTPQLVVRRDGVDPSRIVFTDYDREIALVAEHAEPDGSRRIVAVGRLSRDHAASGAEFSLLVSDPWQGHGLGTELLRRAAALGDDSRRAPVPCAPACKAGGDGRPQRPIPIVDFLYVLEPSSPWHRAACPSRRRPPRLHTRS